MEPEPPGAGADQGESAATEDKTVFDTLADEEALIVAKRKQTYDIDTKIEL